MFLYVHVLHTSVHTCANIYIGADHVHTMRCIPVHAHHQHLNEQGMEYPFPPWCCFSILHGFQYFTSVYVYIYMYITEVDSFLRGCCGGGCHAQPRAQIDIHVYIYIYTHTSLFLSLSLYIYIYIYDLLWFDLILNLRLCLSQTLGTPES